MLAAMPLIWPFLFMATDKDILKDSMEEYKIATEGWKDIYKSALSDMEFTYDVGEGQWPEEIKKGREGRPSLTINKLLKFVRQLRGDARMNRPRIKTIPVDDKGDPKKAELFNGIIRQIEYTSSAEIAYDTAYQNSVSGSIGFFRLVTEYENEMSFDQVIKIKRIMNPFAVKYDPKPTEFDYSDANFCFVEDWLTDDEFERQYPDAEKADFKGDGKTTENMGWFQDKKVRIAERFYKDYTKKKIILVEIPTRGGKLIRSTMDSTPQSLAKLAFYKGKVLDERETTVWTVKWCKISGTEVLEKKDWPGKFIPIIPVMGDEVIVDGKKHILSLIRGAKGPQQMYNYQSSAAVEAVALVPKAPFIIPGKQIEGYEAEWSESNIKSKTVLRYKIVPGVPPPTRQPQGQVPTGIVALMQNAAFELEDSLGRYEASKGQQGNERSGKAILARVAQSDKGTFTFIDNFGRAIIYAGRQMIDLIPKIYDTERALSILGEDGNRELVTVNQATTEINPVTGDAIKNNDLTVGHYDLIATVGKNYSSRRQEALDFMLESMQYAPQLANVIAPFAFKYSDMEGATEVFEALKKEQERLQQMQQMELQMKSQGGVSK